MHKSRTITVSIARPAADVYAFASDPRNLPKWATAFIKSVDNVNGEWFINTADQRFKVRFVEANAFGVLDHYVTVAPGVEVYSPMRVIPNGQNSEVMFTLYQTPDMPDAQFATDQGMIERDLQTLKRVLE